MPKVTFIQPDGMQNVLDADAGTSVMRTAVNGSPESSPSSADRPCAPPATSTLKTATSTGSRRSSDVEDEMLDCTAAERCANSRLSCQLPVVSDLAVRIPEAQV